MSCAKWGRAALFEEADSREMVSTARGIQAITRWMISYGSNSINQYYCIDTDSWRDRGIEVAGGG